MFRDNIELNSREIKFANISKNKVPENNSEFTYCLFYVKIDLVNNVTSSDLPLDVWKKSFQNQ